MSIRIDQGDTGTPGASRDNLSPGNFTATWTGAPGTTYQWYYAVSDECTAVLTDDTLITCQISGIDLADTVNLYLDIDGVPASYTVEYGGRTTTQGGARVLNALGIANPALGERGQFGGWLDQIRLMLERIVAHALLVPTTNEKTSLGQLDGGDQGSVFYTASTGRVARLAPGTTGQFLRTAGAGANPAWADAPGETSPGPLVKRDGYEFVQQSANPGGTPANTVYQDDGTNYEAGTVVLPNKAVITGKVTAAATAAFGGGVAGAVAVLTPAATVTPDCANGTGFTWAIDQDSQLNAPTNAPGNYCIVVIEITQDTVARTLSFGAGITQLNNGESVALPTGSGDIAVLTLVTFNGGTSWYAMLAK